ncbi:hypothetical protein CsSME_00048799 [Camellia sinensis var. sinensis]
MTKDLTFFRCNSEAWVYTWSTPSWEHEVTLGRNRFSIGDEVSVSLSHAATFQIPSSLDD